MSRNPKNIAVNANKMSAEKRQLRLEAEEKLKGSADKITPSSRLNANQKRIFNYITNELEASKILGNIDVYLLEQTAIAIDRLQAIEKLINQDFDNIYSKELMTAKTRYTKDFEAGMNNLSLSPASRAKFGIINANKKETESDPLLKVINGS